MVILGFMLNYMLRINLTIAIVAMVIPGNSSGQHSHSNVSASDECGVQATMMNNLTPTDDTRTPAIDVDVNKVNEVNNGSMLAMFPYWYRIH